ncbi:MAG: monovalent cation/H+ antiporter complex subunit F [Desulfatiglandales bacterium]
MDRFFLYVAASLSLVMVLPMYRVLKGPTIFDRLMGVNAVGTKTVVLLLLVGLLYKRLDMFVDISLAYALLNFIAVVAASRFFYKRRRL